MRNVTAVKKKPLESFNTFSNIMGPSKKDVENFYIRL